MALGQNDLNRLKKSAGNFIYIFIPKGYKGLSDEVYRKRKEQIKELAKIYSYNKDVTINQLKQIVYQGIVERYGCTPYNLLNRMIVASNRTPYIGAIKSDEQAAKDIDNITTNVKEDGKWWKKKKFWQDVKDAITWFLDMCNKLFGNYRNPNVYQPAGDEWKGKNRSEVDFDDPEKKDPLKQEASTSIFPLLLLGGGAYFLTQKKPEPKPKPRKRKTATPQKS